MRITNITIKNFRSIKDASIDVDNYMTLVGANGAGKSTILAALNLFFGEPCAPGMGSYELETDDFHKKDITKEIEITLTFEELTEVEKNDLKAYVRHDKLKVTIKTIFDPKLNKGKSTQFGSRMAMEDFAPFFQLEANNASVSELKKFYESIRGTYTDLPPPSTKANMIGNLQEYEAKHPELCKDIPSNDQFYGIEKSGRLNKFIQWVYIPAVKDAHDEQKESKNGTLGRLLSRTVSAKAQFEEKIRLIHETSKQEYQKLLAENQDSLKELSTSLRKKLAIWSHSDTNLRVEWSADHSKAIQIAAPFAQLYAGEGDFEGQLSRLGHGLQRSYIIALLHELATSNDEQASALILGIEEPELYQHPPQINHLANTLSKLSTTNCQVFLTTHSPAFVRGETYQGVRLCRKTASGTAISMVDNSSIAAELKKYERALLGENGLRAKMYQVLQPQLSEMFFAKKVIFVEGLEDQAFITSLLEANNKTEIFRSAGAHIIPVNGKSNLILPMLIAKQINIPFFVVFDADGSTPEADGKRKKQERDNSAIFRILEHKSEPFPTANIFSTNFVVWNETITVSYKEDCAGRFAEIEEKTLQSLDQAPGLQKNILAVAERIINAQELGVELPSMQKLVSAIEEFCKK